MGKQLRRRSVSLRGETYSKLKAYAESHEMSVSEVVEGLAAKMLGIKGPPLYAADPPPAISRRLLPPKDEAGRRVSVPRSSRAGERLHEVAEAVEEMVAKVLAPEPPPAPAPPPPLTRAAAKGDNVPGGRPKPEPVARSTRQLGNAQRFF